MKYIALISLVILSACGPQRLWSKPGGNMAELEKDGLACQYESNKVGGYDWIDATLRRQEALELCMMTKGYTR